MPKDIAIVLSNGSINSAVATAMAVQKYRVVLMNLQVLPAPSSRLRAAYEQQIAHFKPYREHTLPMPHLALVQSSGASSTNDTRLQSHIGGQLTELIPHLAAGAQFGAHYNASAVYLGLRIGTGVDDLASATEFIQIWNEMIQIPCGKPDLDIVTPLLELEPWQVIEVGYNVDAPLEKTWSCVDDIADPCWSCPGCRSREAAFQQTGKPDPLKTMKKAEALPATARPR